MPLDAPIKNDDRATLEKWAYLYNIKITDQDNNTLTRQLLRRADVIPVPIALAQAAIESGWGTSRFAIKGNALLDNGHGVMMLD